MNTAFSEDGPMIDRSNAFGRSADNALDLVAFAQPASSPAEARDGGAATGNGLRELFIKVERAKQEWEATADSLPQLICLTDQRGAIVRANRAIETWGLGSVRHVAGLPFHELLHPHCSTGSCYVTALLQEPASVINHDRPSDLETYDPVLGRYVHVILQPVRDQAKTASAALVIVLEDITERKQAEEALRRDAARMEATNELHAAILTARSPEAICEVALMHLHDLITFDQAQVIISDGEGAGFRVFASQANGETRLRLEKSLPRETFQGTADRQSERSYLAEDLQKVPDLAYVEQGLWQDGVRSYVNVPLWTEGEFVGSLLAGWQQPYACHEDQLRSMRDVADLLAIATRQAQLHRGLDQKNAALETALQAKEEMISVVTHELRTPLFLIRAYVEIMEQSALDEKLRAALSVMASQTDQLARMVNQLLQFKMLDLGTVKKMPLDIEDHLNRVLEDWKGPATTRAARLCLAVNGDLPPILADANLLSQVFHNLLDNALKFSPNGGLVRVLARAESGWMIISVADEGIGIAHDMLERVFDRFYRVSRNLACTPAGMGLGLAVCREIVNVHGGRIWAESEGIGHGSTFHVALPLDAGEASPVS